MKIWENIYHTNTNQSKAVEVSLLSEKTDTGTRNITRDKKSHFTLIKGSIHVVKSDRNGRINTQIHKDGWQFKHSNLSA